MSESLSNAVSKLEGYLPQLEPQRGLDVFVNDLYEAASYWSQLGRWVLQKNTKVNYPERVRGERELLAKLEGLLRTKPAEAQANYGPVLSTGGEILQIVESVQPPKDGHLGFLRIAHDCFQFLQTDFRFSITKEQPTSLEFSSGAVYLELVCANSPWMSCQFGPESAEKKHFSIQDLLFLYGDQQYRTFPEKLALNTEVEVENWFRVLAGLFKQHGGEVLRNEPGIFDRLAQAQTQRDDEFVAAMNEQHGHH
ncbi:MAG: hypothetical protein WCF68_02540 [Terriglobales bacterium]